MTDPSQAMVRKVAGAAFPAPDNLESAMALLVAAGTSPRIQLAVLKLSEGDLDRLAHYAEVAQQDFRDVLAWAEYPGAMRRGPGLPPKEAAQIRQRDRAQYEEWLERADDSAA